jgi:hypothetical protein
VRPALCLYHPSVSPFGRYAVEMLRAEGLTGALERAPSSSVPRSRRRACWGWRPAGATGWPGTSTWRQSPRTPCASRRHGVPTPNTDAWCTFNERRRGTALRERWDAPAGALAVEVASACGLPAATFVLPAAQDGARLQRLLLGAEELPLKRREIDGREQLLAVVDLPAGPTRLVAHYA